MAAALLAGAAALGFGAWESTAETPSPRPSQLVQVHAILSQGGSTPWWAEWERGAEAAVGAITTFHHYYFNIPPLPSAVAPASPIEMAISALRQACRDADAIVIDVIFERDDLGGRYGMLDLEINKCLDQRPELPIFSAVTDGYHNLRLYGYVGAQNWEMGVRCANALMFDTPFGDDDHSTVTGRGPPPRPYPNLEFAKRCPDGVCAVAWGVAQGSEGEDSGLARRFAALNATLANYGARAERVSPTAADFNRVNQLKATQSGLTELEIEETGEKISPENFWLDAPTGFVTLLQSAFLPLSNQGFFDPINTLNCGFSLRSAPQDWQVGTSPLRDALTAVSSAAAAARLAPSDWLAPKGNSAMNSGSLAVTAKAKRATLDDPRSTHAAWGASCAYGNSGGDCDKLKEVGYIHRKEMFCCQPTRATSGDAADFHYSSDGKCLLSFKGSQGSDEGIAVVEALHDFFNDLNNKWVDYKGVEKVGTGLKTELELLFNGDHGLRKVLSEEGTGGRFKLLKDKCTQYLDVSGHSLGGGMSMVFAAIANRDMKAHAAGRIRAQTETPGVWGWIEAGAAKLNLEDPEARLDYFEAAHADSTLPSLGHYVDKVWGFANLPSSGRRMVNEQSADGCFGGGAIHTKRPIGSWYLSWWYGGLDMTDWASQLNINPSEGVWAWIGALTTPAACTAGFFACGPACAVAACAVVAGYTSWSALEPLTHPLINQYQITVLDDNSGYQIGKPELAAPCGQMPQAIHDTAFMATVKAYALANTFSGTNLHDSNKYVKGAEGGGYYENP